MMGMIRQVPLFDDSVEDELTEGTGTVVWLAVLLLGEALLLHAYSDPPAGLTPRFPRPRPPETEIFGPEVVSAPVIELYPELEAVLEVVDPVLVKGVGLTLVGGGWPPMLVWRLLLNMPRPRTGPLLLAISVGLFWLLFEVAEAAGEATVTACSLEFGDL